MEAQELLQQIAENDNHGFLTEIVNWSNHRGLLLLALELTSGNTHFPVFESGMGDGSSQFLHDYCTEHKRQLISLETNMEWGSKFKDLESDYHKVHIITDEAERFAFIDSLPMLSVAFFDGASGEERHVLVQKLRDDLQIAVLHDSEDGGSGNYMFDRIYNLFSSRLNYNRIGGGAGATALSNTIDLSVYKGLSLAGYIFDND